MDLKSFVSSLRSLLQDQQEIKRSIQDLRESSDDHLEAINENTNELQSNYEYAQALESKLNKLAERIDELYLFVGLKQVQEHKKIPNLTTVEKEVFLALYTLCEEKQYATYQEIAKQVNLSESLVMNYVTILIEKGIPIVKSYSDDKTRLKLSAFFKDLQTKQNILKINEDISQQLALNKYIQDSKNTDQPKE